MQLRVGVVSFVHSLGPVPWPAAVPNCSAEVISSSYAAPLITPVPSPKLCNQQLLCCTVLCVLLLLLLLQCVAV